MAVAFDAASTKAWEGGNITFSHTCTGSNRVLFVAVNSETWAANPTRITYAGVALTNIASSFDSSSGEDENRLSLWRLIAPASGTNTVAIYVHNEYHCAIAASYTGCDQITPVIASSITTGTGQDGLWSDSSVPSDASGMCIASCGFHYDGTTGVDAGQTKRGEIATGDIGDQNVVQNWSDEAGTGSPVAMGASAGTTDTDSITFITCGLQPPQAVTVDVSGSPASGASSVIVGTVDDGNISITVDSINETISISVGAIQVFEPIRADMHIGITR